MDKFSACQSCRSRRIKCDGGKPICQKCIKSRLPCVQAEVAKQSLFVIHSENRYASGKGNRPRGPRSKLIPLRPEYDIETRARAYYLQHHFKPCQDAPELVESWPECYHSWQSSGGKSSIVEHSLSCLALAVFARSQHYPPAAHQAAQSYQCLLSDMKQKIAANTSAHLSSEITDDLILSAYFMARYESILQQYGNSAISLESMKVWSHFDGVAAILRLWYDSTHRAKSVVVRQARRTLLRISILRQRRLPAWLYDGSQFDEREFALDFDTFLVCILDIRREYLDMTSKIKSEPVDSNQTKKLSGKAFDLHQNMKRWKEELPKRWSHQQHVLSENISGDQLLYSRDISTCTKQGFAAVWIEYYATVMMLLDLQIQLLSFMESYHGENRSPEKANMSTSLAQSSKILASFIPCCLDKVRFSASNVSTESSSERRIKILDGPLEPYLANPVVWPVSLASSLQELDEEMRDWFRSVMTGMSDVTSECLLAYTMNDNWTLL